MKKFAYIVVGVVAVAIVASFFIIGTPGDERLRRFDETRVSDLSAIQSEILNFWIKKEVLPQTLNELESDLNYFTIPTDPQTKASYEYKALSQYQFELCANFVAENTSQDYYTPAPYGFETKWNHGIGRTCFTRTIDPELYNDDNAKEEAPVVIPSQL